MAGSRPVNNRWVPDCGPSERRLRVAHTDGEHWKAGGLGGEGPQVNHRAWILGTRYDMIVGFLLGTSWFQGVIREPFACFPNEATQ